MSELSEEQNYLLWCPHDGHVGQGMSRGETFIKVIALKVNHDQEKINTTKTIKNKKKGTVIELDIFFDNPDSFSLSAPFRPT